jgi:Domain of unknown function (DUF5122) beta-propeller
LRAVECNVTSGLGVQSSGDIVILGTASNIEALGFALARYTLTGQLDTTFGNKGTVHTSFGSSFVNANGLAIQSDGKIVAVGSFITLTIRACLALALSWPGTWVNRLFTGRESLWSTYRLSAGFEGEHVDIDSGFGAGYVAWLINRL